MRKHLSSAALPAPRFRYTPCVKTGPFYTVSGMVGLDPATGQLAAGGVLAETRQIFSNLLAALPDYGLSLADLVLARVYTTDFAGFTEINQTWEQVLAETPPPARTSIGVSALPLGALVEIEFSFYRPEPQ